MAELATIARPYAEALFKASATDPQAVLTWLDELACVAQQAQLQQFADSPAVTDAQIYEVVTGAMKSKLDDHATNFIRTVIANERLAAVPEAAAQFRVLVNKRGGTSYAVIYSAFPIEGAALAEVSQMLEQRFARQLNVSVELQPELIGGIRVVVGDEVLDTSVKARLEQMKMALTA